MITILSKTLKAFQSLDHSYSDIPNTVVCRRVTKNEITLTIYESTQVITILKRLLDSNERAALLCLYFVFISLGIMYQRFIQFFHTICRITVYVIILFLVLTVALSRLSVSTPADLKGDTLAGFRCYVQVHHCSMTRCDQKEIGKF